MGRNLVGRATGINFAERDCGSHWRCAASHPCRETERRSLVVVGRLGPGASSSARSKAVDFWIRQGTNSVGELVSVAIVGCGGMGRRHLAGLAELARTQHNNVRLAAVCDLDERKAESLADEA